MLPLVFFLVWKGEDSSHLNSLWPPAEMWLAFQKVGVSNSNTYKSFTTNCKFFSSKALFSPPPILGDWCQRVSQGGVGEGEQEGTEHWSWGAVGRRRSLQRRVLCAALQRHLAEETNKRATRKRNISNLGHGTYKTIRPTIYDYVIIVRTTGDIYCVFNIHYF